ncbi:unnamed protein product [Meloidogyne enterolobii]|uniref:Uncharacterized protein n=1 Tax=Meloidogyne enterolobii TaxID=390850 RepID=A0ACB0YLR7_MELEN
MWPFVQMCKIAGELLTENGMTMFTSVPKRFRSLECIDIYSLVDFERIANKNLIEFLEPLAKMGAAHIESCEHCRQQAFFCQICMDPKDLLFPFQLERCYRCDSCGSLSHKNVTEWLQNVYLLRLMIQNWTFRVKNVNGFDRKSSDCKEQQHQLVNRNKKERIAANT